MKILFLIFHGFEEYNGISKKIHYQIKALKECGAQVCTCYYDVAADGHRRWMADDEQLVDFGQGTWAKIKKRFNFRAIIRHAHKEQFDLVYIRSYHNANPFTINLVKKLKSQGAKVIMEIPTYPYDQEYALLRMKLDLMVDRCFRRSLAQQMDGIVTFSNAPSIFGQQTIRISNGIDFDAIPLKQNTLITRSANELHLIGVAEIHYWHGFDRVIRGLADYYRQPVAYKVYFHIVGRLCGEREEREILTPIRENSLEPYIVLHGTQHGSELDKLFEQADFAIGSLARHRSGITHIKTLKNREYAARGLAFAYSETDDDFEQMPYVMKVSADETPLSIPQLIAFYQNVTMTPKEIRHSIQHLSWTAQMKKVLEETFKK